MVSAVNPSPIKVENGLPPADTPFAPFLHNSSLQNREQARTKIEFLESQMRPLLREHTLLNSKEYVDYKKWFQLETGVVSLEGLAFKKFLEARVLKLNESPSKILDQLKSIDFIFSYLILNAPLTTKAISTYQSFKGLVAPEGSDPKLNKSFGILTTTQGNKRIREAGYCRFIDGKPDFEGTQIAEEEVVTTGQNRTRSVRYGEKIIAENRSMWTGVHIRVTFLGDYIKRETGFWGDQGNGLLGFTGQGSVELLNNNGSLREQITGTWGNEGIFGCTLTGQGTFKSYHQDGTLKYEETGELFGVGIDKWVVAKNKTIRYYRPGGILQSQKIEQGSVDKSDILLLAERATIEHFNEDGTSLKERQTVTPGSIENLKEGLIAEGTFEHRKTLLKLPLLRTGTWGDYGNGKWALTGETHNYSLLNNLRADVTTLFRPYAGNLPVIGSLNPDKVSLGSRELYYADGKTVKRRETGFWIDLGNNETDLMGEGTLEIYSREGNLESAQTGTWEIGADGKRKLREHPQPATSSTITLKEGEPLNPGKAITR